MSTQPVTTLKETPIGKEVFEAPVQLSTLSNKVKEKLETKIAISHESVKDIWQMRYKRGNVIHDLSFKMSLTGDAKKDREAALNLATRYVKWLGNQDNKKVILIGIPKPLALDLEEEMKLNAQIS